MSPVSVRSQTVRLTHQRMLELCERCGVKALSLAPEFDTQTRRAQQNPGNEFITDETFFKMLGVKKVHSIDHTDYEGADIILDLNMPLPAEFLETADFVFGGSVCDNVFDPATYIKNISALLKPGGRFIDKNIISDHYHPYAIPTVAWYFDYFAINGYADCRVYVLECAATMNVYVFEPDPDASRNKNFPLRDKDLANGVLLITEKGADSTNDRVPSQDQYRPKQEWNRYRHNVERIMESQRPISTFTMDDPYMWKAAPPQQLDRYKFVGSMWKCF